MNNEEKKLLKIFIEKCQKYDETVEVKGVSVGEEARILDTVIKALNLIEKQQKEIEDKKEEIYSIAKTNYTVGVLDERNKWYKKINEKIEEYKKMLLNCNRFSDVDRIKAINERILALKELIGKEE
jgi:hypothetical protein